MSEDLFNERRRQAELERHRQAELERRRQAKLPSPFGPSGVDMPRDQGGEIIQRGPRLRLDEINQGN